MSESPRAFLAKLGPQVMLARCIALIAELGIADRVAITPQTPADLATACGVNADALTRMLRFLAGNGVFKADAKGVIHNTPISELLWNVPGSMRDTMRQSWQDVIWDTYRCLPHTLLTGEPAFDQAFGTTFFAYLAEHPEIGARFDASMALMSGPENAAIAQTYPFNEANLVVDVGGGRGGLMMALLTAHPDLRGVLYDQPQVFSDRAQLHVAPLLSRCSLTTGDFFTSVPKGGDIYVLKRILHDWSDDDAIRILKTVKASMAPASRLLVIDAVIKPGNDPDPNKMLDVGIMALTNGRERTADDFQRLFAAADIRLTQIIAPTAPSTMSLVEGIAQL